MLGPWVVIVIALFPSRTMELKRVTGYQTTDTREDCEARASAAAVEAFATGGVIMVTTRCVERGERPAREVALEVIDKLGEGE